MQKRLFIPGPIDVSEDVLEEMVKQMIAHRSKDASRLQRNISKKLQKLFYTKEEIILSTSSGSGLMEGAVRSCTRKKAAIFSSGAFGERWHKIALSNNIPVDKFIVEEGKVITAEIVERALESEEYDLITLTHNETSTGAMTPLEDISKLLEKYPDIVWCLDTVSSMGGSKIEVDKLGIDICITSTQKAMGLPPGLAVASMSKKAVEAARQVEHRGSYFDLLALYEYIQKKDHQYPTTPALTLMYAMDYQLDKILEEGLDNRYKRHKEMAKYVQDWARDKFELFAEEEYLSNTITAIRNTRRIDIGKLNEELGKKGYLISNGYGKFKDETFRISHMGDYTLDDIKGLLNTINTILEI